MLRGCKVVGVEPARRRRHPILQDENSEGDPGPGHDRRRRAHDLARKLTFPLVLEYVDDMLTVTDDELLRAMFFLWDG